MGIVRLELFDNYPGVVDLHIYLKVSQDSPQIQILIFPVLYYKSPLVLRFLYCPAGREINGQYPGQALPGKFSKSCQQCEIYPGREFSFNLPIRGKVKGKRIQSEFRGPGGVALKSGV